MKKKELNELKVKNLRDLEKNLKDLEKQKVEKLIELKLNRVKNVHELGNIKRSIAQIFTLISLKKLAQEHEVKKEAESGSN